MTKASDIRNPGAAEKRKEIEKKREAVDKKLGVIFTQTFATASGKQVLAWFCKESGFHEASFRIDSRGNYQEEISILNEAFRVFYIKMRKHIEPGLLHSVENEVSTKMIERVAT